LSELIAPLVAGKMRTKVPSMAKKILFVLNRKSAARSDLREIVKPLQRELGLDVVVPWSSKQLRKLVCKAVAKGTTRIIAGGGDGTLNKVSNAILALGECEGISLGLVPLGTANDFARSYNDDGSDLAGSLQRAATADARPIDVGCINGRYFVNVASGGFGAMITATTPQEVKRRLGGLAYTLLGMARISELNPIPARIALDGEAAMETSISALVIANNRFAGGGFDVAPSAELTDGLLDIGVISSNGVVPDARRLAKLLDPSDPTSDLVERAQFRTAFIETDRIFHLNLDGEPMQDTRFEVSVLPSRLNFVLPPLAA
jgi:lipid kinase YegS